MALSQPHRGGSDDPRLAFPLGRFCASHWSNDSTFANRMHSAGVAYAKEVRAVKVASGFHVVGSEREGGNGGGDGEDLSPDEIADMRANRFGLERTLAEADGELRSIRPRCPRAMVRLCFDHEEPLADDASMLRHGLYRLSVHYGLWQRHPND